MVDEKLNLKFTLFSILFTIFFVMSRQIIPNRIFTVVEFPGFVENVDRVIEMLGGKEKMNEKRIELKFRKDLFSHAINGEYVDTTNLLVRINRDSQKIEILGYIPLTGRFRSLADFQWVESPMVELKKSMNELNVKNILEYQMPTDDPQIPPPVFSLVEWPLNYQFEQTKAVTTHKVRNSDGTISTILKKTQEQSKPKFISVSFTDPVPSGPAELAEVDEEDVLIMQQMFNERPAYTKVALCAIFCMRRNPTGMYSTIMRRIQACLPHCAYFVESGPFRLCWVKYNYNICLEKKDRIYQTLEIRSRPIHDNLSRAKRKSESNRTRTETTKEINKHYIFDGVTITKNSNFQICDIRDELVLELLSSTEFLRDHCHPTYGWFYAGLMQKIRARCRQRRKSLLYNTEYEPPAEDELPIVMDYDDVPDDLSATTYNPIIKQVDKIMSKLPYISQWKDLDWNVFECE